jgi:hypothetical protein
LAPKEPLCHVEQALSPGTTAGNARHSLEPWLMGPIRDFGRGIGRHIPRALVSVGAGKTDQLG